MSVNWTTHETEIALKWVLFSPEDEASWPPLKVRFFAKCHGPDVRIMSLEDVDRGMLASALDDEEGNAVMCDWVMNAFSFYDADENHEDGLMDGDDIWWLSGLTPGDIEHIP